MTLRSGFVILWMYPVRRWRKRLMKYWKNPSKRTLAFPRKLSSKV
jgi:hypothetical protein